MTVTPDRLRQLAEAAPTFALHFKAAAGEIDRLAAENERLRKQLPEGMQHCTILFKECDKGHGWLTATNWVQHGCPTCELAAAAATIERLRAEARFAAGQLDCIMALEGDVATLLREKAAAAATIERLARKVAGQDVTLNYNGSPDGEWLVLSTQKRYRTQELAIAAAAVRELEGT